MLFNAGVALRRGEYYHVVLGADQIFKGNADYTYFISFKLRQKLNVLHDNDKDDGIQIERPLGTEKFVAEVHFPPTRKLSKDKNNVRLVVYEVRGSDPSNIVLTPIDRNRFTVNAKDPIDTVPGTFTDMFRLTLLNPPQDADIRIMWQWSVVEDPQVTAIAPSGPVTISSRQLNQQAPRARKKNAKTGAGRAGPLNVDLPPGQPTMEKIRILFVSANPVGTTLLKLDEEVREIEEKVRAAKHRESLQLITKWAVRPDDLLQSLNQHKPHVVHFSGHGSSTEEIILLDKLGNPKPVSKEALVSLFRTLKDNIRVVLLNACFSRPQAEAITGEIECAIGMMRAIGDDGAIIESW